MNEPRALSVPEMKKRLLSLSSCGVLIHRGPDGDAVGSGAALCRILSENGIRAGLLCADPIPDRLSFLAGDIPQNAPEGVPLVCVDVSSLSQAGELADRIGQAPLVLTVDHHASSSPFSDHLTVPEAAAAGEVLYSLFYDGAKTLPAPEIAADLYAAISSDTGCFRFSNTTPATLHVAAALLDCGIDAADINHRLFESKTGVQLRAEGYAALHIETAFDGRLAYLAVREEDLAALGCTSGDFDTAIDVVRSLAGAEIAAVIRRRDNGEIRLSLRSTDADVGAFCASFGGGGHRRAAGCTLPALGMEEAAQIFLKAAASLFSEI